jgi:iron-sulfur cluster assembly protein
MGNKVETGFEITITEKAQRQFLKIMSDSSIPQAYALRISLEGSKSSGFTYRLGFDSHSKATYTVITYPKLKLLIDQENISYLSGTTIDYNEEGCCGGFVFNNPHIVNKCDCHN